MIMRFDVEQIPRVYVIQCLKRSQNGKSVFWKENRRGYTENIHEAGIYELEEIECCAGTFGDWIIHPIWYSINDDEIEKRYKAERLKNLADRLSQNGSLLRDW